MLCLDENRDSGGQLRTGAVCVYGLDLRVWSSWLAFEEVALSEEHGRNVCSYYLLLLATKVNVPIKR